MDLSNIREGESNRRALFNYSEHLQLSQKFNQDDLDNVEILNFEKNRIITIQDIPLAQPAKESQILLQSNANKLLDCKSNQAWKNNAVIVLYYISHFIAVMKQFSTILKFRNIKKLQIKVIGDITSHYDYWKYQKLFNKDQPNYIQQMMYLIKTKCYFFQKIIFWLSQNIQLIQPHQRFNIIWEISVFISSIANLFYVPLNFAFQKDENSFVDPNTVEDIIINQLPGWIFILDMLLQFNTARFIEGVIINDRKMLVKYYLRTTFLWDLIVCLPTFINNFFNIRYLDLFLILRTKRLRQIFVNFEEMINLREEKAAIKELLKLIFLIVFTAHICGCGFYLVADQVQNERPDIETWVSKINNDSKDIMTYYINSVYWAVITLITIGYGDISPQTNLEKIYVIIMAFIACGVYAYAINKIGYIVQEMSKKKEELTTKLTDLNKYLKNRQLSYQLQIKVKKYYEHLFNQQQQGDQQGELILNQLNSSLKQQVLTDIYGKILFSKKIFFLNFSKQFILKLAPRLKEKNFAPEEVIFDDKDLQQRKIYFLLKGKINLTLGLKQQNNKMKIIATLEKDEVFGEFQFFTGLPSLTGAIAVNVVNLAYLTFEDFFNCIQEFPLDYEKFCQIKDNILCNNNTRGTSMKCISCGLYSHNMTKCPFLYYQPNNKKIINKSNISMDQNRQKDYQRREDKTQTPLMYLDALLDCSIQRLIDLNPYDNEQRLYEQIDTIQNYHKFQKQKSDHSVKHSEDDQSSIDSESPKNNSKQNRQEQQTQQDQSTESKDKDCKNYFSQTSSSIESSRRSGPNQGKINQTIIIPQSSQQRRRSFRSGSLIVNTDNTQQFNLTVNNNPSTDNPKPILSKQTSSNFLQVQGLNSDQIIQQIEEVNDDDNNKDNPQQKQHIRFKQNTIEEQNQKFNDLQKQTSNISINNNFEKQNSRRRSSFLKGKNQIYKRGSMIIEENEDKQILYEEFKKQDSEKSQHVKNKSEDIIPALSSIENLSHKDLTSTNYMKQLFILVDQFDQLKEYQNYFPHNNFSQIIYLYDASQIRKKDPSDAIKLKLKMQTMKLQERKKKQNKIFTKRNAYIFQYDKEKESIQIIDNK